MKSRIAQFALLLLAACGGGSAPVAPNQPPTFTSATSASIAENAAGAVYQASASDPDGNALTYTISGGADAAQFAITAAGALSFATAPNFEAPRDADGNNVYLVQLRVSDGSLSATLDLAVTVTDNKEGISVKRVGTGFSKPIAVAAVPGDARIFVAEKGGDVYFFDPAQAVKTLAFNVGSLSVDGERGLLGIVAADDFVRTKNVFVVATAPDGAVEVRRYTLGLPQTSTTYLTILRVPHAENSNHNGGWIGYGPDGYLYVGIGDGGGGGDPNNNAQNPNLRLGKILRFVANSDPAAANTPTAYLPAPGNPFISGGGDPFIFALGLRNPFRASFTGNRLLIGDVGQGAVEEIDSVRTDQPGLNFGWAFKEGTQVFRGTPPAGLIEPVSEYGHGTGPKQGASIIGGYDYRGSVTSLRGNYIFGDFVSGNLWSVPTANLKDGQVLASSSYERRNLDFTPDVGTIDSLVSFGEDGAGDLYIVDIDGDLFKINAG